MNVGRHGELESRKVARPDFCEEPVTLTHPGCRRAQIRIGFRLRKVGKSRDLRLKGPFQTTTVAALNDSSGISWGKCSPSAAVC